MSCVDGAPCISTPSHFWPYPEADAASLGQTQEVGPVTAQAIGPLLRTCQRIVPGRPSGEHNEGALPDR